MSFLLRPMTNRGAQSVIRVGLIGFGYGARTFHVPLIQAISGFRVIMASSSHSDGLKTQYPNISIVADPTELLTSGDVDLVVVASPNESHAHWTIAALDAGKHVVVDKPFTLNLAEARGVVARAERTDRLLSVFHNRRWDSDFLSVQAAIGAGRVGRVTHFETHFDRFRPQVRHRWREQAGAGAGIWYDLAPHLVDQVLQLFGLPEAVEANLAALRRGAATSDWAHAVLHYPAHRVVMHASMLVAGGSPRFSVHGELGSLVKMHSDQQEAQLIAGITPGDVSWGQDSDDLQTWDQTGHQQHIAAIPGDQRKFYQAVRAAIREEAPNPVPGHEALAVTAVIEAGLRSSSEGRTVPLALNDEERAAWSAAN
jgi:predicted dehydrogenase